MVIRKQAEKLPKQGLEGAQNAHFISVIDKNTIIGRPP